MSVLALHREGISRADIAAEVGVTEERVRQICVHHHAGRPPLNTPHGFYRLERFSENMGRSNGSVRTMKTRGIRLR